MGAAEDHEAERYKVIIAYCARKITRAEARAKLIALGFAIGGVDECLDEQDVQRGRLNQGKASQ